MAVTVDDMKAIYSTDKSDEDLQVFLDTANLVVDEDLRTKCPMSEDRYDKITLYLAVHFLSISDSEGSGSGQSGALRRSKLGDADESYATPGGDTAFGYNTTRWGQMALALDKCGILAGQNSSGGVKALFRVV